MAAKGAETAATLAEMVAKLDAPRVAWVMVPAGDPTTETIDTLKGLHGPRRRRDRRRELQLQGGRPHRGRRSPRTGIGFIDAGTSGGVWGLANGYCLMVGGDEPSGGRSASRSSWPSPPRAATPTWARSVPGHFVKMVHNGIEYGLMQAYAEGFEIMQKADEFSLDLHQIASIWRYGSVVRSWLLELAERALAPGSGFENIEGVRRRLRRRAAGRRRRPSTAACPPR